MGVCSGFCDARAFKQRAYIPAQNSTEFPFNWTTGSLVVHGQLGVRRDPSQIPRYDATPIQFPDMSTYCQASTCTEQNATSTSTYIHTVRAANLRPLPLRPSPPMPVATENLSTPRPVSHRTPTQRHMHNYSLPSPISMRPTTPRSPTRCQSSPTLSEYRKAVYIAPGFTIDDRNPVFLPRHPPASSLPNSPSKSSTSSIFAAQQADVPPPSLTSSEHNHVSPPLTPDSCSIKRPFTSPRTPTKVKSTRSKGNRLSALSVSSLSFPPISSSTPSYAECDADPFTSAPFSFPSGQEMRSKWSPSSSTISLSHGRDQSAFEKLKGDIPVSTTKLREFFSRLSISRSPTSSTSPFKSTATNRRENRESYRNRPESPMTFVIVDEEKNDPDWLIGTAQNDNSDADRTSSRPDCLLFGEEQDLCSIVVDVLRQDTDVMDSDQVRSPTSIALRSRASMSKYMIVDGIDSNSPSIQKSPRPGDGTASFFSPTMRASTSREAPATRPSTSSFVKSQNSQAKYSGALPIPPPPRRPPPKPPTVFSPPAYTSVYDVPVLDQCLPRAPTIAPPSPPLPTPPPPFSPIPAAIKTQQSRRNPAIPTPTTRALPALPVLEKATQIQPTPRPVVPPRSRLRPPPVKLGDRPTLTAAQNDESRQADLSDNILPLPPPQHSHSCSVSSVASSFSILISPMPTPPTFSPMSSPTSPSFPTSPTSPSSAPAKSGSDSPLPTVERRAEPDPTLDMGVLRALILKRSGTVDVEENADWESDGGSEVDEPSVMATNTHQKILEARGDASSSIVATPEFAWQEEPRAPPSRLSFCESPEPADVCDTDEDDDIASIYSQYSAYTLRSRTKKTKSTHSLRRSRSVRTSRRMTAASMMSVYSQASFSYRDVDMLPVPSLPRNLRHDQISNVPEESLLENEVGEMTSSAPEYAYAYSIDEYVDRGLNGVALVGRGRVKTDFTPNLAAGGSTADRHRLATVEDRKVDDEPLHDWLTLLTTRDPSKEKRTSSNISVVEDAVQNVEVDLRQDLTDVGSMATNGSIGDLSTTSTLIAPNPNSPKNSPLVPNRRQRTVRRRGIDLAIVPPGSYPSTSSPSTTSISETREAYWRREMSVRPQDANALFPFPEPEEKGKNGQGGHTKLRGMRNRVSTLKSRLASLTPRSPVSPRFPPSSPSALSPTFHNQRPLSFLTPDSYSPVLAMTLANTQWPRTETSFDTSSSSSSAASGGVGTSPPSSASLSWTTAPKSSTASIAS